MRKLMWFALAFAGGTGLCQYLLPAAWQAWAGAAALLLGLGLSSLWRERRRIVRLLAFGLAAGILWFAAYSALFLTPAEARVGTEETVTVELADWPEETDYGARATVRLIDGGLMGQAVYYGDASLLDLEPGQRITAPVRYYSALEMGGEASTYYTARGVFTRLYNQGPETVSWGRAGSLRYLPQRLAARLEGQIAALFDQPAAGFISALLTGEREGLEEDTVSDLEEAGLMHIIAVSGLHCGFLISLLGLLLGRRQRLTALVGYPVLLLYMLLVGGTPSVVRSCVMSGFLLFAPLLEREGDGPTSLAGAALVILLANPFAIASISFQLSFAAVMGLMLVTPRVQGALWRLWRPEGRALRAVWSFLASSVSASVGSFVLTAPLCALYFGYLSLVAPLTNLMVLWIAPFLFAGAFLVVTLSIPLPFLAPLAAVPEVMAEYVLWAADFAAGLPGHAAYLSSLAMPLWLGFCYLLLGLCWFTRDGGRKWLVAGVLSVAGFLAAWSLPVLTVRNDRLTVLTVDVGQGAATLLASHGSVALVDCGSHYAPRGAGGAVADAMAVYGWDRLDCVALTHYHEDHAGGLDELLSRVEVGLLYLPQLGDSEDQGALQAEVLALAARYGVPVRYVETVETAELGAAALTLFPPLAAGDTNEEGLTALCTAGDFDALITGDMGESTEELLVEGYGLPDIEVLLVGHHGSRYSTGKALLEAVTPEIGVISVGQNTYGHPAPETMDRMARRGMTLYRTDLQGNILIRVHDN